MNCEYPWVFLADQTNPAIDQGESQILGVITGTVYAQQRERYNTGAATLLVFRAVL